MAPTLTDAQSQQQSDERRTMIDHGIAQRRNFVDELLCDGWGTH
jgi:hypothetical protein